MTAAQRAAEIFVMRHRSRRTRPTGTYRPHPLLEIWCTWEDVRDRLACQVADDVVNGYTRSVKEDAAAYALAVKRMNHTRDRYLAADRAARALAVQS